MNDLTDRIPPQSLEMEQAALGAMLTDRAAAEELAELLSASTFYRVEHGAIFAALAGLARAGKPIDILTAQEALRDRGCLEEVGGSPFLVFLTDQCTSPLNARFYAGVVAEKAQRRALLDAAAQVVSLAHSERDTEEVRNAAFRAMQQACEVGGAQTLRDGRSVAADVLKDLHARAAAGGGLPGVPTGFPDLDSSIGGWQPGTLTVLGGRPSMGKSALAFQTAYHVAEHVGPVLAVSQEMRAPSVVLRHLAHISGVPLSNLTHAALDAHGLRKVDAAERRLATIPIFYEDSGAATIETVRGAIRRMGSDRPRLVLVDYLQILCGMLKDSRNRTQAVDETSRGLQRIARETDAPVLVLSQLSRGVEARPDKRPVLSDLRESGSIEAEADAALFVYRDAYYKHHDRNAPPSDLWEEVELLVRKQRNGPTGTVFLLFRPSTAEFATRCGPGPDGRYWPEPPSDPFAG